MREFCSSGETEAQNIPALAAMLSELIIMPVQCPMAPASDERARDKSQVRSEGRGASQHAAYQNIKCSPGASKPASWPAIIVTSHTLEIGTGGTAEMQCLC